MTTKTKRYNSNDDNDYVYYSDNDIYDNVNNVNNAYCVNNVNNVTHVVMMSVFIFDTASNVMFTTQVALYSVLYIPYILLLLVHRLYPIT